MNWLWDVLEKEFTEDEKSRFLKVFLVDVPFWQILSEAREDFFVRSQPILGGYLYPIERTIERFYLTREAKCIIMTFK